MIVLGRPALSAESLNAYSIWPENWARPMFEEFEKATGVKVNFLPAHPEVKTEASLAEVLKGAKIFPIEEAWAGQNRKRIVDRWMAEVLPQ